MTGTCDQRNPLRRSGTHQDERAAAALDPDSAPLDERSLADLLVFAQRYSRHLKFYDAANNEDGDWLPFFGKDISAILALLESLPHASFLEFSRNLRAWLVEDSGRADSELASHFKLLFHLPLLLLQEAGAHYDRLPIGHPLRLFVVKAVERDVAAPLRELIAYAKGVRPPENDLELFADTPPDVVDYNTTFNDADARIQLPGVVTERLDGATSLADLPVSDDFLAGIDPAGWSSLFTTIVADGKPYADNAGSVYLDIADALEYGAFTKTFERIFQAIERIVLEASAALQASLEFDDHTPHYGLWLAFLQLFENNQTHLNTLTGRHLDFYYKDVLQLAPRAAEPDQVHLLFELTKNVDDHLLAKDTPFKAGKDDVGNAVAYAIDSDFVANRATVAELRSLYRSAVDLGGAEGVLPLASTVANSKDGIGEALSDEAPGWPPFGPAEAPPARVGFAIADRKLFLREATRNISVSATLDASTTSPSFPDAFKAYLTGEEGWFEASGVLDVDQAGSTLSFDIELDGEAPAIVPYDAELHGDEFSVAEPVLKIEFAFDAEDTTATAAYTELRDVNVTAINLLVSVTDGRNFSLQNDFGAIDTAKPFLPFGPTPEKGSALIVGSSEAFSKPLSSFTLDVEWEEELTDDDFFLEKGPSDYHATTRHLEGGIWKSLNHDVALFDSGTTLTTISFSNLSDLSTSTAQTIDNELYSSTSRAGFAGLDLQQSFGHAKYTDEKTLALIAAANSTDWPPTSEDYFSNFAAAHRAPLAVFTDDNFVEKAQWISYPYGNDGTLPYEPYTPKIMSITFDYTSATEPPASFFHLLPFGHLPADTESGRLFPDLAYDGELYIGVADLAPPQRLTLLFQTVDGSANPLKNENTVLWHYLRGNVWEEFAGQDIDDKTSNLTTSAIVGIAVPEDADKEHDVLPSGRHWIRLSVANDTDALNDLLSIDAQAASVTFTDQDNDPAFVATPLPAGTISKLAVSDAAVKKIVQPYESFGGRGVESDDAFYVRVSERLRHKDRASTMWDYERLVLDAFPSVYKVKCINHTELCRDLDNAILADNELRPGHVLVVPVPYISADGPIDPLRPYADKKTLVAIDDYLRARTSPFVELEVQNPKIEEVQVNFDVAFTAEIEDITFYKSELAEAIVRYLTPWSYEEGAEISFGGKWYKSAIIDFVEEQSYVDYVKDFEMYHKADIEQSDDDWGRVDVEVLQATTARSILVSHATHTVEKVI